MLSFLFSGTWGTPGPGLEGLCVLVIRGRECGQSVCAWVLWLAHVCWCLSQALFVSACMFVCEGLGLGLWVLL